MAVYATRKLGYFEKVCYNGEAITARVCLCYPILYHRRLIETVYQTRKDRPLYHLSGVGRYDYFSRDQLRPPRDAKQNNKNMVLQDYWEPHMNRRPCAIYRSNFLNTYNRNRYPHGYLVHEHCWELLEDVLGTSKAQDNVGLLLEIFEERFHEDPYDIDEYITRARYDRPPPAPGRYWRTPPRLQFNELSMTAELQFHSRKGIKYNREIERLATEDIISLRDPLVIPGLKELVSQSRKQNDRLRRDQLPTRSARQQENILRSRSSSYCRLTQLQLDIALLILDHLLDPMVDAHNATIAFAWNIPESYWKAHILPDIPYILGFGACKRVDWDWGAFVVGFKSLQDLPEMKNRRRVLNLIHEINQRLSKRLETRS